MKAPISLETFESCMGFLKEKEQMRTELQDVINSHNEVYACGFDLPYSFDETEIIAILEDAFKLKSEPGEDTVISWWVYDTDFGQDATLEDPDFNFYIGHYPLSDLVDVSTPKKLYYYLCWLYTQSLISDGGVLISIAEVREMLRDALMTTADDARALQMFINGLRTYEHIERGGQ